MKTLSIAAILAAGTAHAQTSWKLASGHHAELGSNEANSIFIPYCTQ